MKSYVWTDESSDNPLSLKDALSPNKQSHRLLMKAKGYNASIVELCNKVDSDLELLFNDLKLYLSGSGDVIGKVRAPIDPDHQSIIQFLRECSQENVATLITSIKSSNYNNSAENCVLLARLLQSMSELCPNLKLCFSGNLIAEQSFMSGSGSSDDFGDKQWNTVCSLLEEESVRFWKMWIELFVNEWKHLDESADLNVILRDFPVSLFVSRNCFD